uniref:Formin-like protein 1 n=1 Tax=Echeneis naucrates TaxID=173247 RepID=A0A665VIS2_ECHNA
MQQRTKSKTACHIVLLISLNLKLLLSLVLQVQEFSGKSRKIKLVYRLYFYCYAAGSLQFFLTGLNFFFLFSQNTMNLPPDKVKILSQYDNEKKWDLICDQERFQVKNPPSAYLEKLKSHLDHGGVSRKFKRRVQESTQVLRELEISLRTNHIGWAQEFLSEENQGLDVLVDYLSVAHSAVSYVSACSHIHTSRVVSQKDDVHLCIMCLRAIMNYQSGFNLVMKHPCCVNEITLSLNDRNPRTKALVLELLAAVCLVRGGHNIILLAFDNFKEVCGEKRRFERLMEFFCSEDNNMDFMVACMQFINIVVHSVENMNFRVHLQFEFTQHGLDDFLERLKFTESDRLLVQIQAYLDNVFDVGALLEDAETKNALLEHMEELQEHNAQVDTQQPPTHLVETFDFQLNTFVSPPAAKEEVDSGQACEATPPSSASPPHLQELSLESTTTPPPPPASGSTTAPPPAPPPPPPPPPPLLAPAGGTTQPSAADGSSGEFTIQRSLKKPIQTKYRMPLFNWQALKSNQVAGTIFNELDDEHVLEEINMAAFEEQFKTKAQSAPVDLGTLKMKLAHKMPSKVSLMEANRAKNLAITLRKEGMAASDICCAIETYNQRALSLDFLELLERFIPTEYDMKLIHNYECEGRPLDELSEEDRFMVHFSKIPRLHQRISTLTFMGNFPESVQLMQPQFNAIIAASGSIKSSSKLRKILEIILAFGNYMNSSKRGPAYGFRLQSLDLLLDTKSTDRRQTLLHFIVSIIQDKYPELQSFYTELHFLDKASLVSLDSIRQDVRALQRGMEVTRREFTLEKENHVLQTFLSRNTELLDSLTADEQTAQVRFPSTFTYFGESSETTPPPMFFPVFVRFIKAQNNKMLKEEEKSVAVPPRLPQIDLIAELKRRQTSPLVREGKDGDIEDIITALKSVPFTARSAKRSSRLFCDSVFSDEVKPSVVFSPGTESQTQQDD